MGVSDIDKCGARYLTGENLKVVWPKFSTLSSAVFSVTNKIRGMNTTISEAENSAQVLSRVQCYKTFLFVIYGFS
jgi:hypothetical protein